MSTTAITTALVVLAFLCLMSWIVTAVVLFELRKEQREHDSWIRKSCDRLSRHDREINSLAGVSDSNCNQITVLEGKFRDVHDQLQHELSLPVGSHQPEGRRRTYVRDRV